MYITGIMMNQERELIDLNGVIRAKVFFELFRKQRR